VASEDGPARQAVKEALGTLLHWSSLVSAGAVVVVAHWLTFSGGSSDAGLVFGASFAVFALLLPAVALLREYVDRRTSRLSEVLRQAGELESQRQMFAGLAKTVKPLQRGIVLAVLAAIASSAAIIVPSVTVWSHPPRFLVFSLADFLTGLALVCLVGTVAALFPFTWHLLIRSDQLGRVERAIQRAQQAQAQQAQAQQAQAQQAQAQQAQAQQGQAQQAQAGPTVGQSATPTLSDEIGTNEAAGK
jgi:hypothetical protein